MRNTKTQIKSYILSDIGKDSEKPMNGGEKMELLKRVMLSDFQLEPVDYCVYGFLFRHSNFKQLILIDYSGKNHKQGTGYYVGVPVEIITRSLKIKIHRIIAALKRLEAAGLITIPFKAGGRNKLGSCYRLITNLPDKEQWYNSDDLPKLKGTSKKKGQGVKDRWQFFNGFYGVMGESGFLKEREISSTSAYILLLVFVLSEWKQVKEDEKILPGWFAVIDRKQIRERLGFTRYGFEKALSRLRELGFMIDYGTGFFERVEKNIAVLLLTF